MRTLPHTFAADRLRALAAAGRAAGSALLLAAACHGSVALAQEWLPDKPIRMLTPVAPAGGGDAIARLAASALSEALRQPVVVDNRPGANGVIAASLGARAPADGLTLLMVATSHMAITPAVYSKVGFDPVRDFQAIGTICDMGLALVASHSVPANNVTELIALAKSNPNLLFAASSSNGSFSHMLAETLKGRIGGGLTHVPYAGEAQALQALLANQTPTIYFGTPAPIIPLVQAGKLKALAVSTANRLEQLPNVPTLNEQGLPGFNESFYYGIVAPAGTPAPIVATLSRHIGAISQSASMRQAAGKLGCAPLTLTAAQFSERIKTDLAKFAGIANAIGLKLD